MGNDGVFWCTTVFILSVKGCHFVNKAVFGELVSLPAIKLVLSPFDLVFHSKHKLYSKTLSLYLKMQLFLSLSLL